ncbi:MAG TPA: 30S ribosomal protein S6 [Terriglobales bacterium]
MSRSYEVMYIIRPDLTEEDLDKLITTMEHNVETAGGVLKNTERMGRRRLAYNVRKFNDGFYILMNIEGEGKVVAEIERRLRVSEPVIKFITVRKDEIQKKVDKMQQLRATRVKRSSVEAAPAPVPVEAAPAPEAQPTA